MKSVSTPTDSPGKTEILDSPEITKEVPIKDTKKYSSSIRSPLIWNGTYLGTFTDDNILYKFYAGTFEYWIINYQGYLTTCMIKLSKYYNQCLVDELKMLFGLSKLGTHYASYKDKYVILTRARTTSDNKYIVTDYTLNCNKITKGAGKVPTPNTNDKNIIGASIEDNTVDPLLVPLVSKIREIYIFRDLLGLQKSTDSCIAIRRSDTSQELYPISLIDSHIKPERLIDLTVSTYLPDTVFNKWFKDESPTAILKKMCNYINKGNVTSIMFKIRNDIENTVKRVCGKEFADLPDMIAAKISQKLQHN